MDGKLSKRNAPKEDLSYRKMPVAITDKGGPATLDETTRSIEVVGATENPVPMMDWSRGEMVPEVLLMSGCEIPENRQMPLLDNHDRFSASAVIGSFRDIKIANDHLIGRAYFSAAPEVEGIYTRVKEGHLTDFSAGYRVLKAQFIPSGQKQVIQGRSFEGPVKVVSKWTPKEMSICPLGGDAQAKARSEMGGKSNKEEVEKMEKKVRQYLESRGLPQDATEEEAYRFLEKLDVRTEAPSPAKAPAAQGKNEEEIRAEATRAEQARTLEIRALCDQAGVTDEKEITPFITENKSVEEVRKAMFERVMNKPADMPGYRPSIEMGADQRDKFRSASADALVLRGGGKIEKPAAGAVELRGYSLKEMAREALRVAGQPFHGDAMEMVGRALTNSDLPIILGNTANKHLYDGYEGAEETWPKWCDTGSVNDFKTHTSARMSETDDLDEISEDDEYKYGKASEAKEEYKVVTYGKLFKISRQAIINDDLGAISRIPRSHGEAAARKIGDIAYAVLTANSAMGDGTALFHANHGNLGIAGALSVTTLGEAEKLMGLQKDLGGKRRLNIRPQFFLAPLTLKVSAETFFRSQLIGTQAAPNQANIYGGDYFNRVYEARLDDASTTAWYIAGAKGKTVVVFFLGGNQTPYLETKQGWNVDGVEYKVRIDAGAKAMDWKALAKNAGV